MLSSYFMFRVLRLAVGAAARFLLKAIPHNSKYRYGERGAASAGAVLKPQGGNCAVLPKVSRIFYTKKGRLCVNRPVLC
jgi:hypothetical protein